MYFSFSFIFLCSNFSFILPILCLHLIASLFPSFLLSLFFFTFSEFIFLFQFITIMSSRPLSPLIITFLPFGLFIFFFCFLFHYYSISLLTFILCLLSLILLLWLAGSGTCFGVVFILFFFVLTELTQHVVGVELFGQPAGGELPPMNGPITIRTQIKQECPHNPQKGHS